MLKEGTAAPEIEAELGDGTRFALSDYRDKSNVVLYFYPKDFTPGCTREACSFRDSSADLEQLDAIVVGVSADSAESHESFSAKHELSFPLIPDPQKQIIKRYDAVGFLGLTTARITYVIDKEGIIRRAIRHDLAISRHLEDTVNALRSIQGVGAA